MHDPLLAERAAELLRKLGYYGHAAFQLQLDPKDGVAKLLGINCRLSYRAWCEIEVGLNLPLLTLQSERRENIAPTYDCSHEAYFVYPVEDVIGRLVQGGRRFNHASNT